MEERSSTPARPAERLADPDNCMQATPEASYEVFWARSAEDIRDVQRLRYEVFAGEMGAQINHSGDGAGDRLDRDAFDDHCEHLVVRTRATDHCAAAVVGTYRVLTPDAARRAGGYYTATEFDLSTLAPLQGQLAELGRSCVHRDHRSGPVILSLWAALARFLNDNGLNTVIGCASVSMHDGGHVAASLWHQLRQRHLGPDAFRVTPRLPLPVDQLNGGLEVALPALIKGYLRCGAKMLGAPAWDPDFNTADLPMMLRLSDLPPRYRKHFLGA